ncbi:hypothetical protein J1614_004687 [Plenodomus biglobosus]|nr:hypothetical protein J1614_004687 [Plenodomus biglobosus]
MRLVLSYQWYNKTCTWNRAMDIAKADSLNSQHLYTSQALAVIEPKQLCGSFSTFLCRIGVASKDPRYCGCSVQPPNLVACVYHKST